MPAGAGDGAFLSERMRAPLPVEEAALRLARSA
ncbi:MAG: hypothetical protein AVDCRST_MAG08-1978 [uncultured Acetobacteraceae bacterium]|uniref:Uncharacterized protein n=1 Tax=uncultured Acetobacteraceae bacterium TaxID=169975 RepID=A0A6J4IC19_9PROT|nr:MAG: hypothetical protein AVDCRST_MAG08-1978 [uncultured Acetobacteraceae bacterium]